MEHERSPVLGGCGLARSAGRRRKPRTESAAAAATPDGEGAGRPPSIEHASDWIDVGREVRRRAAAPPCT